jgi:soluble P-type ATPase
MMLEIPVPGFKTLRIDHLVLDYNGTLACDGRLIDGVRERLLAVSRSLELHVLTADTHGNVAREIAGIPCGVTVIPRENEAESKLSYMNKLGHNNTVYIGNGRNDRLMLNNASLGIAVIQTEGCAREAILAADVVTTSILDALDLIIHPLRLIATLRS